MRFNFVVLSILHYAAKAFEVAPLYVRMPSGILVRADSSNLYVSISNETERLSNVSNTFVIFTAPNNNPTQQTYSEPEIVFGIDRMSYGVQLCYELRSVIGNQEQVSQKCATEIPEWIEIVKVFQLEAPIVSYSLVSNKIELTCTVSPPDNEVLSQLSIVYEIELECLSGYNISEAAGGGFLVQRHNVSGTCNVVYENLDANTWYRATVRAFLNESLLKSAPGSVEFSTRLTPPGSNPAIVGFEKVHGRILLLLERPSRSVALSGLQVETLSCLSDEERELDESLSNFKQQTNSHSNCSILSKSDLPYQTVLTLPSRSVGSFQVELVGKNAAGWSTAAPSRALISDVSSGSHAVWATVEEVVPILFLGKTVLCWSATIHFSSKHNVTIGSGPDCVRQLVISSILLHGDEPDTTVEESGKRSQWNAVSESTEVQIDWVRCESDYSKSVDVLESGQRRLQAEKHNGTLELAAVGISEQVGLAVTIYSKYSGREVYRTPMEYGRRCTFRARRALNDSSVQHTLPTVDVALNGDTVSVLLPVNSCNRLVPATDWFLEYEVSLELHQIKKNQRLRHVPGDKPVGIVPCKAGNCHSAIFRGLLAGTTYRLEVTGRTLDGQVTLLHTQRLHVAGLNVDQNWIIVCIVILAVILLLGVVYFLVRYLRKERIEASIRSSRRPNAENSAYAINSYHEPPEGALITNQVITYSK